MTPPAKTTGLLSRRPTAEGVVAEHGRQQASPVMDSWPPTNHQMPGQARPTVSPVTEHEYAVAQPVAEPAAGPGPSAEWHWDVNTQSMKAWAQLGVKQVLVLGVGKLAWRERHHGHLL